MQQLPTKNPYKVSHQKLAVTPTFEPGLLAVNANHLTYMQNNDMPKLFAYNIKDILAKQSINPPFFQLPHTDNPTSLRYHTYYGRQLLVVTCVQNFYILNETVSELLHEYKDPELRLALEEQETFFIGSCIGQYANAVNSVRDSQQQFVVVGSTNFWLYFASKTTTENAFQVQRGFQFKNRVKQITCLESVPAKSQLLVCDQEGCAHLYLTLSKEEINFVKTVCVNNNKMPITCCRVLQQPNQSYLCCGDFVGKLTLIDLADFIIYAQINAHVRLVTDITCLDSMQLVASASEDTYINIWSVKQSVELEQSVKMADQMVMGLGATDKTIMALCYDSTDITIITI